MSAPVPSPAPLPATPTPKSAAPEAALIDLRHVLMVVRERWLGAAGLALVLCGLVGFGLLSRPAVYEAKAALLVERQNDRVVDIKQVVDTTVEGSLTDALLLTHIEQLQSHTFFQRVAASLSDKELKALFAPYAKADDVPATELPADERSRAAEGFLADNLKVERAGRTLLINLSLRHRDPLVSQWLVNRIAEQYILHLIDRSSSSNTAAIAFLGGQAEELRKKVEVSERDLQAYRTKYNLVSLEENQNIVVERLKALSSAVTQSRVARLATETRLVQVEGIIKTGTDVLQLATMPEFAGFAATQKEIDQLQAQRAVLGERYGARHPQMIDNARALAAREKLRDQQLTAALGDLRNQRDKAVTNEAQLATELAAAEKESLRLDQLSIGYNVLRREVETNRQLYSQILGRQNETGISSQLQNTNIKIVDRAGRPDEPVSPNRKKVALIVVLLFGAAFFGYALAADLLDNRVKAWTDVEQYLGSQLLAEIAMVKEVKEQDRALLVAKDLDEHGVEAFRGLHSQLQLSSKIELPKTILVTSTLPGEGKSFVAANLAASFAAHGKRTVLVDGDFRRPTVHRLARTDNQAGTLVWLQSSKADHPVSLADPALGLTEITSHLQVLRTGGVSRKVSEMLESRRLIDLFEALQRSFDVVVIDTPPAGVFPDAEAFTAVADELIYVCRFSGPSRVAVRQVLGRLRKSTLSVAGVVLNAMPGNRGGAHYYSGYGYYGSRHYADYYNAEKK